MGRNAKLRKQRKQENQAEAASAIKQSSAKEKAQEKSFFKKLTSWFSRAPSVTPETVEIQALDFSKTNNLTMGAIAWEGYQKSGKGLVLVDDSGESSSDIEYVPLKFLKKSLSKHRVEEGDKKAIATMIDTYKPEENLVMVYVNNTGEMTATITPKLDPIPPECYRLQKENK